jgi:ParB family chromosome partitioning protein
MDNNQWNVVEIPVQAIVPDPNQPRKTFEDAYIAQLAESIENEGLNNPVTVRVNGSEESFILVNGECRYKAHLLLDMETIPAFIKDFDGDGNELARRIFVNQVVDNSVRKDPPPSEEIRSFYDAIEMGEPIKDLSGKVGISVATIEADLPLVQLPPNILKALDDKTLPKVIARKLADLVGKSGVNINKAFDRAMTGRKVDEMESALEQYLKDIGATEDKFAKIRETEKKAKETQPKGKETPLQEARRKFKTFKKQVTAFDKYALNQTHLIVEAKKNQPSEIKDLLTMLTRIAEAIKKDHTELQAQLATASKPETPATEENDTSDSENVTEAVAA